ncbi:response regulator [Bacillus sp. NPDC094106]|uniref:response regulator n=1 Tax=Bacillus sp. NPDC094106 TaxID=3363949 RepID=UPI00381C3574
MRAIVVDDETLILHQLKRMLDKLNIFHDVVCFDNSKALISYTKNHSIDVAFLDIEMPEINGITLARELQSKYKDIKIIFITGHDNYAVEAFEIYALDYIMKPITRKRLSNTINRLMQSNVHSTCDKSEAKTPILNCLGELSYIDAVTGSRIILEKWRTKKSKELFLYLLHNRNKIVNRDSLIELLWPNIDFDQARVNLHSAIYQLRQTIHFYQIDLHIIRMDDGYKLDLQNISVDVDIFENQASLLPKEVNNETLTDYTTVASLYKGDYLSDNNYWWAEGEKTRLRNLYFKHAFSLIRFYVHVGSYNEAIDLCLLLQGIEPFEEDTYEYLIFLYAKTGNQTAKLNQEAMLFKLLNDNEMPIM